MTSECNRREVGEDFLMTSKRIRGDVDEVSWITSETNRREFDGVSLMTSRRIQSEVDAISSVTPKRTRNEAKEISSISRRGTGRYAPNGSSSRGDQTKHMPPQLRLIFFSVYPKLPLRNLKLRSLRYRSYVTTIFEEVDEDRSRYFESTETRRRTGFPEVGDFGFI